MVALVIPRPLCRHGCGRLADRQRKGLCQSCGQVPAIRDLYPSASKYGRRGIGTENRSRPLPAVPTTAVPGTPEKIAVFQERIAAGQQLFHPDDGTPAAQQPATATVATPPPAMRRHVSLNMAYVRFRAVVGRRRVIYLGPWGSQKAAAMYRKFCAEWPAQIIDPGPPGHWSTKRLISFEGRTQNLRAWAIEHGLRPGTLGYRLGRGLPMAEALTKPLRKRTR